MKLTKRLSFLAAALVLLLNLALPVQAHPVPDLTKTGSISVTMRYGNKVVPGGTLTLYRVGDIHEDDGNYSFVLTSEFAASSVSLEDPASAKTAKALAKFADKQSIHGERATISRKGKAKFTGLRPGLYLLVQYDAAKGYNKVDPFLVTLPIKDGDSYTYDVDASPKLELEPAPTTPHSRLPQTGQLNWPVPVLSAAGMFLLAAGWWLGHRRKEE